MKRALFTAATCCLTTAAVTATAEARRTTQFSDRAAATCVVPDHFGRMFPSLQPGSWPVVDLNALAARTIADEETNPTPEGEVDSEENPGIDAGYTYVGQLIDHDLDLDNRPNDLTTPVDPTTLKNGRSPALDLDNIYGSGPVNSPQLYAADNMHLKFGSALSGSTDTGAVDLPRDPVSGQAFLGDGRDDENRLVAGVHSLMLRLHNQFVDRLSANHPTWSAERVFAAARERTRLHYQWAVVTDFLPQIVGGRTMVSLLGSGFERDPSRAPRLRFYKPCQTGVPVEFSGAAYRFGHSMVRPIYRINSSVADRLPVFSLTRDPTKDLGGFQPAPSNFAIDWKFFFQLTGQQRVVGQPQSSYMIDGSLAFPLSLLPLPAIGTGPSTLSTRNLLRGQQLGLPSGQSVARALGARPLTDDQVLVGPAVAEGAGEAGSTVPLTTVSAAFAGKAPLWSYVLAESVQTSFRLSGGRIVGDRLGPGRLGPVGGRIVAETILGLLAADGSSIMHRPGFQPDPTFVRNGRFGWPEFVGAATRLPDVRPPVRPPSYDPKKPRPRHETRPKRR